MLFLSVTDWVSEGVIESAGQVLEVPHWLLLLQNELAKTVSVFRVPPLIIQVWLNSDPTEKIKVWHYPPGHVWQNQRLQTFSFVSKLLKYITVLETGQHNRQWQCFLLQTLSTGVKWREVCKALFKQMHIRICTISSTVQCDQLTSWQRWQERCCMVHLDFIIEQNIKMQTFYFWCFHITA